MNLESLVEAKLDLCLGFGVSNPTNLINGLKNVEVLELSSYLTSHVNYDILLFFFLCHMFIIAIWLMIID